MIVQAFHQSIALSSYRRKTLNLSTTRVLWETSCSWFNSKLTCFVLVGETGICPVSPLAPHLILLFSSAWVVWTFYLKKRKELRQKKKNQMDWRSWLLQTLNPSCPRQNTCWLCSLPHVSPAKSKLLPHNLYQLLVWVAEILFNFADVQDQFLLT